MVAIAQKQNKVKKNKKQKLSNSLGRWLWTPFNIKNSITKLHFYHISDIEEQLKQLVVKDF